MILASESKIEVHSSNLLSKILTHYFEQGKAIINLKLNDQNQLIFVVFIDGSAVLCSFEVDFRDLRIIKDFGWIGAVNGFFAPKSSELVLLCWEQIVCRFNLIDEKIVENWTNFIIKKTVKIF